MYLCLRGLFVLTDKDVKNDKISIVFRFQFGSLKSLESAFNRLHESNDYSEMKVKQLTDDCFRLSIIRMLEPTEENIKNVRLELSSDVWGFGGRFIDYKHYQVYKNDNYENKKVRKGTKLLFALTSAMDGRTYKVYRMPFLSLIIILLILFLINFIK
jgi:hypothetical protein